jgi:hypothetical protein
MAGSPRTPGGNSSHSRRKQNPLARRVPSTRAPLTPSPGLSERVHATLLVALPPKVAIATARKIESFREDLGSGAAVADLLGVSRSRITRWLKGEGIDPLNAERVDLLELVWSNLGRVYDGDAAREWLLGSTPTSATAGQSTSSGPGSRRSSCAPSAPSAATRSRDPPPLLRLGRARPGDAAGRPALVPARLPGRRPPRQP